MDDRVRPARVDCQGKSMTFHKNQHRKEAQMDRGLTGLSHPEIQKLFGPVGSENIQLLIVEKCVAVLQKL